MAGQRKTKDQRLEELRRKQEVLKAQMTALETKKRAEDRRRETRRAFVVGAAALSRAETDLAFRDALRAALEAAVMRQGDRAIIADLLGIQVTAPDAPATEPETGTPKTKVA